jgi:hypothetical protein
MVIVNFCYCEFPVKGGREIMKKFLISVVAMALSSVAMAGPNWTYLDLGIVLADSAGKDTAAGAAVTGSFGLDLFHGNLTYMALSDAVNRCQNTLCTKTKGDDYDSIRVGVGIHPAVTDSTDMVVEIGYTDGSYDDASQDPDAIDLSFGVRSMITDEFELSAMAIISDGSADTGSDDDFQDAGFRFGGQYFFSDAISVNASVTQGQSVQTGAGDDYFQIGGRWNF